MAQSSGYFKIGIGRADGAFIDLTPYVKLDSIKFEPSATTDANDKETKQYISSLLLKNFLADGLTTAEYKMIVSPTRWRRNRAWKANRRIPQALQERSEEMTQDVRFIELDLPDWSFFIATPPIPDLHESLSGQYLKLPDNEKHVFVVLHLGKT